MRTVGGAVTGADVSALEQQVADAKATADQALATGQDARRMVVNTNGQVAGLKDVAQQYGSTAAAADAIHQNFQDEIVSLQTRLTAQEQRQMTPGPKGDTGPAGKDGLPGKDGAPGGNGVDGKSAYQLAREGGYGGTQTQWLASLKGADGAPGKDGAAGQKGADGVSPVLSVGTVATGAAGSSAAVSLGGTQAAPVLSLTIPRGDKGTTGDTGPSGTANLAVAAAPVTLLALGASTNVTVQWSRTMPNTTYTVQCAHSAVVSLANVTFTVSNKTTTGCTINVKSVGLALAAGTLVAVAF